MAEAFVEHVNVAVSDSDAVAAVLCNLFGWRVRWKGRAINGGTTVHVGSDRSYVAVNSGGGADPMAIDSYRTPGALNHVGVVVNDLAATEERVAAAGFTPCSHADYEPGPRFYVAGPDDIEIEVVSYA